MGVASFRQLPEDTGNEVAFAGRSNVGKSSAINKLTNRRALARTSKQPGRTRELATLAADRRPADWRARAYLARIALEAGERDAAERRLDELAALRPRSATLDLLLWQRSLAFGFDRERAAARARAASSASLWADPWVCERCRTESEAFLWRCPGCRGWDTLR